MADTSPPGAGSPSEVTATAMRVLGLLAGAPNPPTAAEVARRLDLGEPETEWLLDRLAEDGFAARTEDSYRLGDRIIRLARRLDEHPRGGP